MALVRTLYNGGADWLQGVSGESGVAVVNTTDNRIHVMDGKTKGGHALALLSEVPTDAVRCSLQTLTAEQKAQVRANIGAIADDGADFLAIYENAKNA